MNQNCIGCKLYEKGSDTCYGLMFRCSKRVIEYLKTHGCKNPYEKRLKKYHITKED